MDGGFDLRAAARAVIEFRDARDWDQFHQPKDLMQGLAIEAAELLETTLWKNPTRGEVVSDPAIMTRIRAEIADVVIYCLTIANDLEIDLADAIEAKLVANGQRYTVEEYRGSDRKAPHDTPTGPNHND